MWQRPSSPVATRSAADPARSCTAPRSRSIAPDHGNPRPCGRRSNTACRLSTRHNCRRESVYAPEPRSDEHTSELQSLMRIAYAVFCLKKKKKKGQPIVMQKHIHNKSEQDTSKQKSKTHSSKIT